LELYFGIGGSSVLIVEPDDPLFDILGDDGCVLAVKASRLQIEPETDAVADEESIGSD